MSKLKVAPSFLSCNFAEIGEDIKRVEAAGADWIHLDVMDGHFVPNITIGPPIVAAVRPYTGLPFDVHLMIDHPLDYIDAFADAGADIIAFHAEAKSDIADTIARIKARGVKAGLVIKPKTPPETVYPYLDDLYMVLVMTVEPGFGGQAFMADMMPKVTAIKQECQRRGLNVLIEVDGGISEKTAPIAAKAGVDICVSGTCVFKAQDIAATIHYLQNPLE
ncbi:MAG: ribulose-phosphate 3-epimerase [Acutalibacteraceae bacterium]|nr:ribulose-phosphate 3-epimerase [Acutalibacteraceae bacterium]